MYLFSVCYVYFVYILCIFAYSFKKKRFSYSNMQGSILHSFITRSQ